MWVMPLSAFVELGKLMPHQLLKEAGKIVQFDTSMQTIFFLSHQCANHADALLHILDVPQHHMCCTGGQGLTTLIQRSSSCARCSASFCV